MPDAISLETVRYAVIFLIALILSTAFHEFGHALVADRLGDRMPRSQGRVTLNPMAHVDPFGTLLFPLIGIFLAGGVLFGWGRPVQVNPLSFTRKLRMKTGHLLVAIAGPTMNVALALLASIVYVVVLRATTSEHPAAEVALLIRLNFVLAALNLLPCPPLDGGAVLAGVLPDRYGHVIGFLQQYGFFILLALLLTGAINLFFAPVNAFSNSWMRMLRGMA
ncbi:MAG: site-2 protease family protein [Myxococcota bacterium]